jgi:glycosyltransferase involved in cell wall biosynthesis
VDQFTSNRPPYPLIIENHCLEELKSKASELHIGLVGPLPPPSGGMANQTDQLARLLQQEGMTVTLIQVNSPYYPAWVGRIRGIRAIFRLVPYLMRLWTAAKRIHLYHVMANSGWSWHLYAAPVIWIAWIRRKPVIINYRGGEAENFFDQSLRWIRPSLKRVQTIIVPSGFLEHVFKKYGFETIIVPNIIDLSRFSLRAGKERETSGPHIIVTRNLEPIYDIATAIRAFDHVKAVIPMARLTIAGSGPERASLENLVIQLGLGESVQFVGRMDNEAIAALYQDADLMINPSLVDNMPISILEALASGVPVVSTDVGGVPFLVTHGKSALLVPSGKPEAMAEAILTILNDQTLARQLVLEGVELVQRYAWPNVRNRLLAVYQRVLHTSSANHEY